MTPRYYLSFSHLLLVVLVVFLVPPLWILTSNNKKHMLVDLSLVHSGSLIFLLQLAKLPEKDIVEMIFFPVVNEACRVFAEGIAVKAADLDISSLMGMGFPPYRFGFYGVKGFLSLV
jgi:Mn2+/Fe2+ NRAMP family transporter